MNVDEDELQRRRSMFASRGGSRPSTPGAQKLCDSPQHQHGGRSITIPPSPKQVPDSPKPRHGGRSITIPLSPKQVPDSPKPRHGRHSIMIPPMSPKQAPDSPKPRHGRHNIMIPPMSPKQARDSPKPRHGRYSIMTPHPSPKQVPDSPQPRQRVPSPHSGSGVWISDGTRESRYPEKRLEIEKHANAARTGHYRNVVAFKVILLGKAGVGKTSLVAQYIYKTFDKAYEATVGVDFVSKSLKSSGQTVKLQLWDTAGQERFGALIPSYVRDSRATIIVYDVSSRESFDDIERWVKQVRETGSDHSVVALIGNKKDLLLREVSYAEGVAACKKFNLSFFVETSAKENLSVGIVFQTLADLLQQTSDSTVPVSTMSLSLKKQKKESFGCC